MAVLAIAGVLLALAPLLSKNFTAAESENSSNLTDIISQITNIAENDIIEQPSWAQATSSRSTTTSQTSTPQSTTHTATYQIATNGSVSASESSFASFVSQTLNDSRGWSQLGITFNQVSSGGDFTITLAQAELVPTYSSGCSTELSCRVGANVIINNTRWLNATDAWSASGDSLDNYRRYVINHEVGHWLGHNHASCTGAGSLAPIMLQQSVSLGGCTPNPWPTTSELWTSRY